MRSPARLTAIAALVATGWLVGAAAATSWLLSSGAPRWLAVPFRLICHGIAQRSIVLWGEPMPICARCAGIHLGIIFVSMIIIWLDRPIRASFSSAVAIALTIPLIVDGVTQALGLRESTNELRLLTGLLAGSAFIFWTLSRVPQGHTAQLAPRESD